MHLSENDLQLNFYFKFSSRPQDLYKVLNLLQIWSIDLLANVQISLQTMKHYIYNEYYISRFKDGAPLSPDDSRVQQTALPDGTVKLSIDHVTPADCGAYKLVISNPHGDSSALCAVAVNRESIVYLYIRFQWGTQSSRNEIVVPPQESVLIVNLIEMLRHE